MKQNSKNRQFFLKAFFLAYCVLMLWLLFGRSQYVVVDDYWEQMRQNVNLVPFRTIKLYLYVLTAPDLTHLISHAVMNLAGNVVMFIPLGFFLGAVFPKMGALWKIILVTVLMISIVEIVQLITLVGSCDVDDLLLNVIGAGLGYGLLCIIRYFRRKK